MKAFLALFDLVPGVVWAVLLAIAIAVGGTEYVQLAHAQVQAAEARADLSAYKAASAESARLAERAERHEEARRFETQRKAIDDAAIQTATAQADLVLARDAGERLRVRANKLAAAAREASRRAGAVEAGAPGGDPIGVLADVLGRCGKRVEFLAGYADRARIAGKLCERSYDALIP